MKRTNIHLEESQVEKLSKLAKEKNVPSSEILRRMLDLGLSLYSMEGPVADIEYVRQKMIEKRGGTGVDYQEEFRELAREKAIEYRNLQNNSARITTIAEKMDTLVEANLESIDSSKEMKAIVMELVDLVRSEHNVHRRSS